MTDLEIYVVYNDGPHLSADGKPYFDMVAHFSVVMTHPLLEAIFLAVRGRELAQYEGVEIENADIELLFLNWVPAQSLKPLATIPHLHLYNSAMLAYLTALPDDNPVGLVWFY